MSSLRYPCFTVAVLLIGSACGSSNPEEVPVVASGPVSAVFGEHSVAEPTRLIGRSYVLRLDHTEGCLFLDQDGERLLPIFPREWSIDGSEIRDESGAAVVAVGQAFVTAGIREMVPDDYSDSACGANLAQYVHGIVLEG